MPYTKEQLKAYYQINKAKLNQQRSERRKLARLGQTKQREVETVSQVETRLRQNNSLEVETTLPKEKVETPQLENIGLRQVETSQVSQPKKEVETSNLWSDYYSTKKPYCFTCQQKGIKENEYAFCSTEKKPTTIYDE